MTDEAKIVQAHQNTSRSLSPTERPELLAIIHNAPPFMDASAVTALKRVMQFGKRACVISKNMASVRGYDESLLDISRPFFAEHHILDGPVSFNSWENIKQFVHSGLHVATSFILKFPTIDTLYSRAMFPHSHFLAALIKVKFPHLRWIAEFSDPLSKHVDGSDREGGQLHVDATALSLIQGLKSGSRQTLLENQSVFSWAELLPTFLADQLLFTNASQQKIMSEYMPSTEASTLMMNKGVIDRHPTLPPEYYTGPPSSASHKNSERVKIGYFGYFYANRGLGPLFQAASRLPEDIANLIEFHIHTNNPEDCIAATRKLGLSSRITFGPMLEYKKFLEACNYMDYLLVNDVEGGGFSINPYLPSKYSDYAGSSARIWSLVTDDSELAKLPSHVSNRVGDIAGIASNLRTATLKR